MFEQPKDRPVLSSSRFQWRQGFGTAPLSEVGLSAFPKDGFYVLSERTQRRKLFVSDQLTNAANEFFDGEAMVFISIDAQARVRLTLD